MTSYRLLQAPFLVFLVRCRRSLERSERAVRFLKEAAGSVRVEEYGREDIFVLCRPAAVDVFDDVCRQVLPEEESA